MKLGGPLNLSVIDSLDELVTLGPAWEELADRVDASLFPRPAWCIPWWEHLGAGRLDVVVVFAGDDLVALAPLHTRTRAGVELTRFLGHGIGAVSEMLVAPEADRAAALIWDHLLEGRRRFIELLEYRSGGGGLRQLEARPGGHASVAPRDVCPIVKADGDIQTFLAGRSKSLRRTLRKGRQAIERAGGDYRFEIISTVEQLGEVLPAVAELYTAAEQARPRLNLFARPWRGFFEAVLYAGIERGQVRLFVGRVDGEAISVDVGFVTPGAVSLYAGRIRPDARDFAPGHTAMEHIVDHAASEGRHVDFLLGDDPYKAKWSTASYATVTVHAARSRVLGAVMGRVSRWRDR